MQDLRRYISVLMATFLLALAGCGGGSNLGKPTIPQGGFTNANLVGSYAFSFSGTDSVGFFFAVAGSLNADGAGHITGGVEDINRAGGVFTNVPISGTYAIQADGRGKATLNSSAGSMTLAFVVISAQHGLVSRFDTAATGSGTLDLQSAPAFSTTALAGTFALNLSGIDAVSNPEATLGSVTTDATGAVTSGVTDLSDNGVILSNQAITIAGSSITVGANGRGTATIVTTTGTLHFALYVVDANHVKLVETDVTPVLAGDAFRQSGPFTNASLSGPFAFTVAGADAIFGAFAAGGVLTSDGAGNITSGTEDINDAGAVSSGLAVTGTYSLTTNRGTLTLSNTAGSFNFVIYPSTGGVQVIEIDTGFIVSGFALQQSGTFSNATIQGNYGSNFTAASASGETDAVAEFNATGAGSLKGITDINNAEVLVPATGLTGSYTVGANGRGPLTLNTVLGAQNMTVYVVNANRALFIERDINVVAVGELQHQ